MAYLDSDNIWKPEYLQVMASLFATSDDLDVAYCGLKVINRTGGVTFTRSRAFDRRNLLEQNYIDINIVIHRVEMVEKYGYFSDQLARFVDWDLILRYTKDKDPAYISFYGADYFLDEENLGNIGYRIDDVENIDKIYEWNREERDALGLND